MWWNIIPTHRTNNISGIRQTYTWIRDQKNFLSRVRVHFLKTDDEYLNYTCIIHKLNLIKLAGPNKMS